jgi:hypothetical protein
MFDADRRGEGAGQRVQCHADDRAVEQRCDRTEHENQGDPHLGRL